jgi:hypothetical protein
VSSGKYNISTAYYSVSQMAISRLLAVYGSIYAHMQILVAVVSTLTAEKVTIV